jgi:hypothetical protein
MIMPFVVATALLFGSLLIFGAVMHVIVRVLVGLIRRGAGHVGFWKSTAVMAMVTAVMAAGHLIQIAEWATAFLVCGEALTLEKAFYLSAQCYTALGTGDVLLSERWRLLGPFEAINGLTFFGLSTAVLFTIMSQLIAHRLRSETGDPSRASAFRPTFSAAGDAESERPFESSSRGRRCAVEDA